MKKILLRLKLFFQHLFDKEFKFLQANYEVAVKVTNTLKEFVESPVADVIVSIIPGNLDAKIVARLRSVLPVVAAEMAIAHGIIQQAKLHSDVVAGIIRHLQAKHPEGRVGFWLEFSGRLNYALADGKITFAEAVALAQVVYDETRRQKK